MIKLNSLKYLFGYLVVVVLFSALCLIYLPPLLQSHYINGKVNELTHLSSSIEKVIEPLVREENWPELENLIQDMFSQLETRISIILTDGKVIAETYKDLADMESHFHRPEVRTALRGEVAHRIRYSSTTKEDMLYVAVPFIIDGQLKAVIRLSVFLDELDYILKHLRNRIILITIFIILLAVGVAYLSAHQLKRPLQELIQGFKKVGDGNLETRILLTSQEPIIKELINQFNRMTERINQIIQGLLSQSEELNSIIATIPSAIVLLDEKGKIILSNDYFDQLFSFSSVNSKEKYYWEILRKGELTQKVSALIEQKSNFTTEIEFNGNVYLVTGSYLEKKKISLLVFSDITSSKKLEQVKKELVTNISHELRTPLAVIKGYFETLELANTKDRAKYLAIIKRNMERLNRMISELLLLSELEDEDIKSKINMEKVDLGEVIGNVHKFFTLSLQKKNLGFKVHIPPDLPRIEADYFKIEQMFINLIDNAIKFTEKGEITVFMELINGKRIKIEIADTGIGVKKDELSRIFERFYVANRARSKKEGGTGLGLSIVKHIVLLHKGEISIDSQPGLGTKVKIILPVDSV